MMDVPTNAAVTVKWQLARAQAGQRRIDAPEFADRLLVHVDATARLIAAATRLRSRPTPPSNGTRGRGTGAERHFGKPVDSKWMVKPTSATAGDQVSGLGPA